MNFYKDNETDEMWWVDTPDEIGPILFSFDKKIIYNFWTDYPDKLTEEEIEIFKKTNPLLAELK